MNTNTIIIKNMKRKPEWWNKLSTIISLSLIFVAYQITNNSTVAGTLINSTMTYGRFLDFVESDWIKKVDMYDAGHTAFVDVTGPEIKTRSQKVRIMLPNADPELVEKLRMKNIDIDSHQDMNNPSIFYLIKNLITSSIPLILILVPLLFFLSQSGNILAGQIINFTKSNAKFFMEVKTGITFNDIAGIDEAKADCQEIVHFLENMKRFDIVGAEIPKGIVLAGPPGTGKTLLAKAVAGEAGVPFFSIAGSEFVETFAGLGASRVRDLFRRAKKNSPCIIFVDEIDAIGGERGMGIDGNNDEKEQTLNQLLAEMDGYTINKGIIMIAATNRLDILDPALLRPGRFDRQIMVDLPDIKGRIEILKVHSQDKKLSESLSIEMIARRTTGFSGADLSNLLNEAAILAARGNKESITRREIEDAIDKVKIGLEGPMLIDAVLKRISAYHEVGRAIVSILLCDHAPVQKITLIPRGELIGLTGFRMAENQLELTKGNLLAQVKAALAGKITEEIVFGYTETTTGVKDDVMQFSFVIREMVMKYAMSDDSSLFFNAQTMDPFFDEIKVVNPLYSDELAKRIDIQVETILQHCHSEVVSIIKENRVLIDILADTLMHKETMTGEEFTRTIHEFTTIPLKKS